MERRRTTTKDVALLQQLHESDQLVLAPEFQRNSVWPRPAKAYLIDSILKGRPIPPLFFLRASNAQTGKSQYQVIDGQQRLRAVFEFMDGRFSLTMSDGESWSGRRWSKLSGDERTAILEYDFVVEELTGYTPSDIRDMFARINRYVVPINAQERRRAQFESQFIKVAEEIGTWPFWLENRVFSKHAIGRHRADEFVEELFILLIEGPQDKKSSIELYITQYSEDFEFAADVRDRLKRYLAFISKALPGLKTMQLRRPVNLYALIGAIDQASDDGSNLKAISAKGARAALEAFDLELQSEEPSPAAARYVRAASRQTDNLAPRETRIATLQRLIETGA